MKVLVMGSLGFIGSHVYEYFSLTNDVWGVDVLKNRSQNNYIQVSNTAPNYDPIFECNKFVICINASGNGSVPVSLNRPVFDFELNVTNTIRILDSIRTHNPSCRFINLSSAAVYGNPMEIPVKETALIRPLSPYGWHKFYSEQVCKEYYYLYDLHTINLRLFSIYGENLRKQLFWDIYQKCLRSNEIELFGSGTETRDFIYINDLMTAITCIIERGLFNGEAINVGSGIETAIKEAATIFCSVLNENIKIKFNKIVKPGDPLNWKADIKVLQKFGFEPKFSITEGLTNAATWLKENI
jgi:UDP-glucose 4-epimerase